MSKFYRVQGVCFTPCSFSISVEADSESDAVDMVRRIENGKGRKYLMESVDCIAEPSCSFDFVGHSAEELTGDLDIELAHSKKDLL